MANRSSRRAQHRTGSRPNTTSSRRAGLRLLVLVAVVALVLLALASTAIVAVPAPTPTPIL